MSEKNETGALKEQLFYKQKNGYDCVDLAERLELERYCDAYKAYLNDSRTEREAVRNAIAEAEENGFVPFTPGMELKPGMKVYRANRGKSLLLAVVGKKPLSAGCTIAAAHVDSPRLDLKPMPLYEDGEMCYLKTHYYGGIKKYQWVTIPLEIHGVVSLKNGETVDVVIGRDREDPQFIITDLLIHLAADQMQKKASEVVSGENLNVLTGSVPYDGEETERVKLAILSMLNDRYGITEEDLLSAELEVVPGFDVRDIGLDRSLIGGYGHDDRVCAYAELKAIFDVAAPETTAGKSVWQSDQYALGIMLFQLLTGILPFRADDPEELAALHREHTMPLPQERNPLVQTIPAVNAVIVRMTMKDPAERYDSWRTLLSDLEKANSVLKKH